MQRLVSTYSIVARDAVSGQMGVAVQSHFFSVGSVVPWGEAGVGVVATQSFVDVAYGPLGIGFMRAGKSAQQALDGVLASDPGNAGRQVAMLDALGRVAAYTGPACIPSAGHITGSNYSVQANLMANDQVWPAMSKAFESVKGSLAEKFLATLDAAETAGGDIRGKQSAAMLIVNGTFTGRPWIDRAVDLRVEDHPEPLAELRRLLHLHLTNQHFLRSIDALVSQNMAAVLTEGGAAAAMSPDRVEMSFWHATMLALVGQLDSALPIFRHVFEKEPHWAALVPRLPHSGLLPKNDELIWRILEVAPNVTESTATAQAKQ